MELDELIKHRNVILFFL